LKNRIAALLSLFDSRCNFDVPRLYAAPLLRPIALFLPVLALAALACIAIVFFPFA
jgi:hypothetical protein